MTPRERFDTLPERAKAAIIEQHHNINTTYDWWDAVEECFSEDMDAIGIHVTRMYFTGFWSQGDGACFEGYVYDWKKYLPSLGYTDAALIQHGERSWQCKVAQSGHYFHENCTRFDIDVPMPSSADDEDFLQDFGTPHEPDSLHEAVWMAQLMPHAKTDFEQLCIDNFRDHMRALYRRLEEEHESLTSDEAILDSLDANDILEDAITEEMEHQDA